MRARAVSRESTDIEALAFRYLSSVERETFDSLTVARHVPWLLGRVAAKDAVRHHLVSGGFPTVAPTSIVIDNDDRGCPTVSLRDARVATRELLISIAHKPQVAVAIAASFASSAGTVRHPCDRPSGIGIDIESVEDRSSTFEVSVLSPAERRLRGPIDDDRNTWLTRVWTVKEAAAKATGLGFGGRPKDFEIDLVEGSRFRCAGDWIATECFDLGGCHFVNAWTDIPEADRPW